jgi:ankyrin repeat protein
MRLVVLRHDKSVQNATSPDALAKVLAALASLSQGKLANITIAGGLDTLWLAAVAEWLLCLKVEIVRSGQKVYQSSGDRGSLAHVTVIFDDYDGDFESDRPPILANKCYVVPKGHRIYTVSRGTRNVFMGGRSKWDEVLSSAFGSGFTTLLDETLLPKFATILFAASIQAGTRQHFEDFEVGLHEIGLPIRGLHYGHRSSQGQGFLDFATKRLPELTSVIKSIPRGDLRTRQRPCWKDAMDGVMLTCNCWLCRQSGHQWDAGFSCQCRVCRTPAAAEGDHHAQFCLRVIIETVLVLLWILSGVEVEESVQPSTQGLKLLYHRSYQRTVQRNPQAAANRCHVGNKGFSLTLESPYDDYILSAIITVFSGAEDGTADSKWKSAISSNGVCVLFQALEDLNLPPESASTVRVVPGYIEHEGTIHREILDFTAENDDTIGVKSLEFHTSYELLVQEPRQPGSIAAAYRLYDSVRSQEQLLGISRLVAAIARSIGGPIRCRMRCYDWNFPHHPRETLSFTSLPTSQAQHPTNPESLSSGLSHQSSLPPTQPLYLGWSLIVLPSAKSSQMDIEVITASLPTLYSILVIKEHICLMDINACLTCIVRFCFSSRVKISLSRLVLHAGAHRFTPPHIIGPIPHGAITITSLTAIERWKKNVFKFSPVRHSDSALEEAFLTGDPALIEVLLDRQSDLEFRDNEGHTSLHRVAALGHQGMLQLLLRCGANTNAESMVGFIPLQLSVENGHSDAVKWLLEVGCDHRLWSTNGTALRSAIKRGDQEMTRLLLQHGADPNSWTVISTVPRAYENTTALSLAAETSDAEMVKLLLENGADPNLNLRHSEMYEEAGGGKEVVDRRERVAKIMNNTARACWRYKQRETPLQVAVRKGDECVMKLLREKGAIK